jgi:GNAT superfamily N-acetyltransferase
MSNAFVISSVTEEERKYILNAITEYNNLKVPFTQTIPFEAINFVIKNEDGKVIGGILCLFYCWGILYIDTLWVHELSRGIGIGTQLIQHVEKIAKTKGCSLMHLDTYDFQAKDFYLKLGFEVYGILEDCPPFHKRFNLKKKL